MAQPVSTATPPPPRRRRRGLKAGFFLILLLIVAVLLFAAYVWAAIHYDYSSGERAGYVQKFSRKGWVCKTWEGELAMANLPGTMPQIFTFSVRDGAVADQINKSLGGRVRLHYEQHKGLPTNCFGETEYFVTGVEPVGP
ncbi:MAG: hypothetical protein ACJ76Y_19495 [Thermoanaerobaculia bacterium]